MTMRDIRREIEGDIAKSIADEILKISKEYLEESDAIATGNLLDSGKIKKLRNNIYEVGYNAPYAKDVDFGLPPTMVPLDDLVKWVKIKNTRKGWGYDDKQILAMAQRVQKSIFRFGTKPQPYLRKAYSRVKNMHGGI